MKNEPLKNHEIRKFMRSVRVNLSAIAIASFLTLLLRVFGF